MMDLYLQLESPIWEETVLSSSIYDKTADYNPTEFMLGTSIYQQIKNLAEKFLYAGYEIQKSISQENKYYYTDALSIPMLFFYRHSLELLLKSKISEKDEKKLRKITEEAIHSLVQLYNEASPCDNN